MRHYTDSNFNNEFVGTIASFYRKLPHLFRFKTKNAFSKGISNEGFLWFARKHKHTIQNDK